MVKVRKSRKKGLKIQAEHVTFGQCLVIEHRATPTGNDVLVAEFLDGSTRTLLAAPQFWKTPAAELKALPIAASAAPVEDEPEVDVDALDEAVGLAA